MACQSCGSGGSGQRATHSHQPNPDGDSLDMRGWIASLGWYYIGRCGCAENRDMFLNNSEPKFRLEVSPQGNTLYIYRIYTPVDAKKVGVGGPVNYRDVYNYHVVLEQRKYNEI